MQFSREVLSTWPTKLATEVKVGDELVERDGCLLKVTSVRRSGRHVVIGLHGPMGPLNDYRVLATKRVYSNE